MRWLKDMGCDEGRQRQISFNSIKYSMQHLQSPEFAGTLLGFDDYVSTYDFPANGRPRLIGNVDMVLEDVTELYAHPNKTHWILPIPVLTVFLATIVETIRSCQKSC